MSKRFGATPSDGALNMDEEVGFRENLDPEQLVRLQINRCNIALTAGDEISFANSVKSLLAIMPSGKRGEIEAIKRHYLKRRPEIKSSIQELDQIKPEDNKKKEDIEKELESLESELEMLEEDSYIKVIPRLKYEYYCGVPLGTEQEPMLNEDGSTRSPRLEDEEETDWYRLFTIIQDKLEEANLSWKQEQINEEGGRIPEDKKKIPPPTPTLAPGVKIPEESEEEEDE